LKILTPHELQKNDNCRVSGNQFFSKIYAVIEMLPQTHKELRNLARVLAVTFAGGGKIKTTLV
jgi:translation initiation factor 1 (eIF-1/SUI1)